MVSIASNACSKIRLLVKMLGGSTYFDALLQLTFCLIQLFQSVIELVNLQTINEKKLAAVILSSILSIIYFICQLCKLQDSLLTLTLKYGILCGLLESYLLEQQKVLILIGFFIFFFLGVFQINRSTINYFLLFSLIIYSQFRYALQNQMNTFDIINFIFLQMVCLALSYAITSKIRRNCSILSISNQSLRNYKKYTNNKLDLHRSLEHQVEIQILKNLQEMQSKGNNLIDKSFINDQKLDQSSTLQLNNKKSGDNLLGLFENHQNIQNIQFPEIFLQKQVPSIVMDKQFSQKEVNQLIQSGIEMKFCEGLVLKCLNFTSVGIAVINKKKQLVFYNRPLKKHLQTLKFQKDIIQRLFSLKIQFRKQKEYHKVRAKTFISNNLNEQYLSSSKIEHSVDDMEINQQQKGFNSRFNKGQTKSLSPKIIHISQEQQSNVSKSYKRISLELNQIGQKKAPNSNYFNYSILDALKYSDNLITIQDSRNRAKLNNDNKQCSIKWLGQENRQLPNSNKNTAIPPKRNSQNQNARSSLQNRISGQYKNFKIDPLQSTTCSSVSNKKGTLKSCSFISTNKTLLEHLKSQKQSKQNSNNFLDQNLQYMQCLIPNSIEKLFQINQLSLEDIVNYILKNAESSQLTKFKTDHIIYKENEEEGYNNQDSDSSLDSKITKQTQCHNNKDLINADDNNIEGKQRYSCGQELVQQNQNLNQNNKFSTKRLDTLQEIDSPEKIIYHLKQQSNLQIQQEPKLFNNNYNNQQIKNQKGFDQISSYNLTQQIQENCGQDPSFSKTNQDQNLQMTINKQSKNQNQDQVNQKTTPYNNNKNKKQIQDDDDQSKTKDSKQGENNTEQYQFFIINNHLHVIVNIEQSYFEIDISCIASKEDETDRYVMIEMNDITQLKRQVDNENLKRYKQRIFSSISHELRTPLNCSIQMLDLLSQNEDIQQNLKEIFIFPALYSNQLLLNIINDILDLAQIDYGQFRMNFEQFELEKICIECLNLISIQAIQKKITLDLEFDLSIPKKINSDSNRLRQVLLNLLNNALKFTQTGRIKIKAYLFEENLIQIDVEDTGCGIPKQNLNSIIGQFGKKFSEEEMLDWESKEQKSLNTQGAGLGLTIANNLAAGLGGNRGLKVQSIENKGSIFSFFIINNPITKKGCFYKQTDIFNKQIINWEYFSEQSIAQITNKQDDVKQKNNRLSIPNNSNQKQDSQQSLFTKMKTPTSLSQINENYNIIQNNLCFKNELKNNSISLSNINENMFNTLTPNSLNINFNKNYHSQDNLQQCTIKSHSNSGIHSDIRSNNHQPSQNSLRSQKIYTISCIQCPNSFVNENQNKQISYCQKRKSTSSQSNSLRQSSMATYLHIQEFNNDFQFSLSSRNTQGESMNVITSNEQASRGSTSTILTISNSKEDGKVTQSNSASILKINDLEKIVKENKSIIQLPQIIYKDLSNYQYSSCECNKEQDLEDQRLLNLQNVLQKQEQKSTQKLNENKRGSVLKRNINQNYPSSEVNSPFILDSSLNKSQSPKSCEVQYNDLDETCILNWNESNVKNTPNYFNFQQISLKRNSQNQKNNYNKKITRTSSKNTGYESKSQFSDNVQDFKDQNNISSTMDEDQQQEMIQDCGERKFIDNNQHPNLYEFSFNQELDQLSSQDNSNYQLIGNNINGQEFQNKMIKSNSNKDKVEQLIDKKIINQQIEKDKQIQAKQINKKANSDTQQINQQQQNDLNKLYLNYNKNSHQQVFDKCDRTQQTTKEKLIQYNQNKKKCSCTNVLIVDDNEFNLYALEIRLKQYKFIIDKATSGESAIQLVQIKHTNKCCQFYDIIFMDIDMPVKNGYETTSDIMQFFKRIEAKKLSPISACTAYVQESERLKAKLSGMQYYITKPINQETLENTLESAILTNQTNQLLNIQSQI